MTEELKAFSSPKREPIRFRIDDDVFEAVPAIGGFLISEILDESVRFSRTFASAPGSNELNDAAKEYNLRVTTFLDTVLLPDSALRLAERLRSVTEPIEMAQVYEVYTWLIQQYSKGRPTTPSLSSPNGHGGTGTSSTDGAQQEESTPST